MKEHKKATSRSHFRFVLKKKKKCAPREKSHRTTTTLLRWKVFQTKQVVQLKIHENFSWFKMETTLSQTKGNFGGKSHFSLICNVFFFVSVHVLFLSHSYFFVCCLKGFLYLLLHVEEISSFILSKCSWTSKQSSGLKYVLLFFFFVEWLEFAFLF